MTSFKIKIFISVFLITCLSYPLFSEDNFEENIKPLDGELLLPEGYSNTAEEKKCITVCDQWGEDCIINPSSNSGARKCRRVCQSFAETCF